MMRYETLCISQRIKFSYIQQFHTLLRTPHNANICTMFQIKIHNRETFWPVIHQPKQAWRQTMYTRECI